MMDFAKIYCHLHPHELVTNFCNKEQCLIGLCANCICTHTQLHVQKGTNPDYENIRTTYRKAQESIHGQVQQFQEHKERISVINSKVQEKRGRVREIIDMAKDEVSLLLGNYFEEKERNMLKEIESEEKKLGLHCEGRLQSLNSYISREVSTLVSAAQELSSNNFLEALPRIRTQCLVNSAKLQTEVQAQIAQNQRYNTTIQCNKGLLNSLIGILERSITLGFSGIPANRINPFNGPSNEKVKKQPANSARRPHSMGKTTQRTFTTEPFAVPVSPVPTYLGDRNTQSQASISQPRYPQPAHHSSNHHQIPQHVKNSYLSEIPNFKKELKTVDFNNIPKISSTYASNSNPSHTQNYNQSYMSNPQQGVLQQLYNPNLNVYSGSRLQEKGQAGLAKKQKKFGLKLANEGESETRNMQNKGPGGYF